ncbi:hypothetical protein BS78_08G093000 [Paspalum vaginatum]|nr:hypothetical protein BS78_08G093000 [Paspalum vaginatum]
MAALLPLPLRTAASFHLLFLFFLPAATRTSDAAQLQDMECSTDGNYTTDDAYAANLNQFLAALPTNTVSKNGGFFNGTVGQGTATVYGLALCFADFSLSDCKDCLTAAASSGAASGLVKSCPGSVTVGAIYDQCMLRYSNLNFFGTAETDIKFSTTRDQNDSSMQAYKESLSLKQALADLSAQAASSPERFAASSTAPYAVVQCTWDLPSDKCKTCIDALSTNASNFMAIRIDGERKSYSCRVRYSNSSFTVVPLVGAATTQESLAPTGPPPGPSSSADRSSKKAIIAGVLGGLGVVGVMIAVFFCATRKNHSVLRHKRLTDNEEGKTITQQKEDDEGHERRPKAHVQGEEGHEHLRNVETSTGESETAAHREEKVLQEQYVLERILAGEEDPKDLPLHILKAITKNFSEDRKIGAGGFGVVYEGVLRSGSVAVKSIVVNETTMDDKLFYRELQSLLKIIEHPNVVRFLGFCANTHEECVTRGPEKVFVGIRQRLLCFEYISNGSLDKHIAEESTGLAWHIRYQLVMGICEGLRYLHEEMEIVHMDLKPANILVDNSMVPKITDFGLASLNGASSTTDERFATREYCAPEYLNAGTVTTKCDIYSLGVTIIELVTGQRGIPDEDKVLQGWRQRWGKRLSLEARQVKQCIRIAKRCMEKEPHNRPHDLSEIIKSVRISPADQCRGSR